MEYFHRSTIKGLTELKPFTSYYFNLKKPPVYLTTGKQLALHYIWDEKRIGAKMPMLDIRKDGVLVFQEMFSGALENFYKGVSGYIYRCIGDYVFQKGIEPSREGISSSPANLPDLPCTIEVLL